MAAMAAMVAMATVVVATAVVMAMEVTVATAMDAAAMAEVTVAAVAMAATGRHPYLCGKGGMVRIFFLSSKGEDVVHCWGCMLYDQVGIVAYVVMWCRQVSLWILWACRARPQTEHHTSLAG